MWRFKLNNKTLLDRGDIVEAVHSVLHSCQVLLAVSQETDVDLTPLYGADSTGAEDAVHDLHELVDVFVKALEVRGEVEGGEGVD